MRSILLSLALLIVMWAAPAEASQYKGYYYGAENPGVIADLVERSLARDPTGRTMLDAAKCRKDGSCAAPINYLESFQKHDPHGGWTMANMGSKMRALVIDCTLKGKYQMDRIILVGSATLGRTDVSGMARHFKPNECAWVNPETRRPVLAPDCANPVGQRIDLKCVYVNFDTRQQAEFSVIWARYNRSNDECFAYRRVDQLFQADSATAVWHQVPRGCLGYPCDLTDVNRALGRQNVAQGQIPLDSPGIYQIRLSPEELLVLCLKLRTGQGVVSSFSAGVRWQQDYRLIKSQWHARVYYQTNELFADGLQLSGPRGLVFWASNREAEAQMRGVSGAR